MHSLVGWLLGHALGVVHLRLAWPSTLRDADVTTAASNAVTHPCGPCGRAGLGLGLGLGLGPVLDYDVLVLTCVYPIRYGASTGTPAASVGKVTLGAVFAGFATWAANRAATFASLWASSATARPSAMPPACGAGARSDGGLARCDGGLACWFAGWPASSCCRTWISASLAPNCSLMAGGGVPSSAGAASASGTGDDGGGFGKQYSKVPF